MNATARRTTPIAALAGLAAYPVLCSPVIVLLILTGAGVNDPADPCGPAGAGQVITAGQTQVSLDAEQVANAAAIVGEVARQGLPRRASVIAVATAAQESSLRNLDHGDRDSLGLFQQRPSAGWSGTDALDPARATAAFLRHLTRVPGWQVMPLWEAAAQTQRPRADLRGEYAKWETLAAALTTKHWPAAAAPQPTADPTPETAVAAPEAAYMEPGGCTGEGGEGSTVVGEAGSATLPEGVVLTGSAAARTAARFAIAQLGEPYVYGANGPDAWDCSSLMQAAWAAAGVALPRTTFVQVHQGTPVTYGQARTGDLVFIPGSDGTASNPGHVGMILDVKDGALLIIQAPQAGENVKITSAASWASQIVAIRRVG